MIILKSLEDFSTLERWDVIVDWNWDELIVKETSWEELLTTYWNTPLSNKFSANYWQIEINKRINGNWWKLKT